MKHINILLIALVAVTLVLVGCSNVNDITKPDEINQSIYNENEVNTIYRLDDLSNVTIFPLIAGNDLNVGTVSIMTEKSDLLVTYNTTNGWLLRETNLNVLQDLKRIPVTKNNIPDVERFAFRTMHYNVNDKYNQGVMEYSYKVPLDKVNSKMITDFVIVANAVLVNEKAPLGLAQFENSWGGHEIGPGPGIWRYIQYSLNDNNPGGERPDAEIDAFTFDDKAIQ